MSMRPDLSPGCWGSILAAHAASKACVECSYREGCFSQSIKNEPKVYEEIQRKTRVQALDDEESAKVMTRFKRFLIQRKRSPDAIPDRKTVRSCALSRRFEENQIDVLGILDGKNPFDPVLYPIYNAATKVIIESRAFKPKDIISEVKYMSGIKIESLSSDVSRFLTALVNAGVLDRKEGKILCLSK